jgi:hypothetical protein
MRLQHAGKTASTLPADTPEREHARAVIVAEVDRLRWWIWNGKDAKVTLERIRAVMPAMDGAARDRPLSHQSKRLAGQLCRTPSCRSAGRHVDHRRHRQLPGQPPHEQIAADAIVPASANCPKPSTPPQSWPWRHDPQSLDGPGFRSSFAPAGVHPRVEVGNPPHPLSPCTAPLEMLPSSGPPSLDQQGRKCLTWRAGSSAPAIGL